jgi:hypothetical protein
VYESPRWLLAQGYVKAAEAVVESVERGHFHGSAGAADLFISSTAESTTHSGFWQQGRELIACYRGRVVLGCLLDFSEAAGYYGLFAFLALFILPSVEVAPRFIPWFI